MRAFTLVAIIAAVVVVGASACSKDESTPKSASDMDSTAKVCAEAQAESAKAADDYTDILLKGVAAIDDAAKTKEYQEQLSNRMTEWQTKLTTWSTTATQPDVKKALADGADMVGRLNAPDDHTGLRDTQQQFTEFRTKLTAACGS